MEKRCSSLPFLARLLQRHLVCRKVLRKPNSSPCLPYDLRNKAREAACFIITKWPNRTGVLVQLPKRRDKGPPPGQQVLLLPPGEIVVDLMENYPLQHYFLLWLPALILRESVWAVRSCPSKAGPESSAQNLSRLTAN